MKCENLEVEFANDFAKFKTPVSKAQRSGKSALIRNTFRELVLRDSSVALKSLEGPTGQAIVKAAAQKLINRGRLIEMRKISPLGMRRQ